MSTAPAPTAAVMLRPGPRCTVCWHPRRAEVEVDLCNGTRSIRGIAKNWDLSPEALRRHLRQHVESEARDAFIAAGRISVLSVAERLADIADAARDVREEAEEQHRPRVALWAGDAEARALSHLADRLGLSSAQALGDLADARALADGVARAISRDPSLAEPIAVALDAEGSTALAHTIRRAAEGAAA